MGRALVTAVATCALSTDRAVKAAAFSLLGMALWKGAACEYADVHLLSKGLKPDVLELGAENKVKLG